MAKNKSATRRLLFILIGLVVVLVILGVVASQVLNRGGGGETVETARVQVRTLTQVVTSSGKVQPEVEVIISPDVSGEVIQLTVKEGQQVRQGELLARIKPDFYSAQVEQAEAGVLQNKAMLEQRRADLLQAENELKRQQSLFEKQAIAESVYQQAQTQYEVAKASYDAAQFAVQSSEARLRESREQLAKTALYAPMDGTVSKLDIEPGERVVGTSQMQGTEMMRIARLDQMEMEVDINENDVVNVSLGDTAAIEIDAYPEQLFKGVVTEIANSARVTAAGTQEQVTNFPVKIRILDSHNIDARVAEGGGGLEQEVPLASQAPNFRPGMSGTVDIFTETVGNVIAVPIQAVTVRDFNQMERVGSNGRDTTATEADESETPTAPILAEEDLRKVVFVVEDGKAEVKEVETGIADDRFIEIKSGLESGMTVIIGPYRAVSRTLQPGMSIVQQDARPSLQPGPPAS